MLYNLVCIVGSYICFCTVEGKYKKFGKSMFEEVVCVSWFQYYYWHAQMYDYCWVLKVDIHTSDIFYVLLLPVVICPYSYSY